MQFAAIARPRLRTEEVGAVAALGQDLPHPLLVAAPYVNPQAAERARAIGLAFVDTAGNVHLRGPGLVVFVAGRRAPATARPPRHARGFTAAGLRVVFALLLRPRLAALPYREIAAATGVALGTVAAVLDDLARRGHLAPGGDEERRLLAPRRLAEEWTLLYPTRLRPTLLLGRFTAADPAWWEKAPLDPARAVWGGDVAAARLTRQLVPARQTLYIWGAPDEVLLANRLRPDARGPVELLRAFWQPLDTPEAADVAPPLLVYADLMATGDPRAIEVAEVVRARYLHALYGRG
jgi:hypothetical protein